MKLTFAYCILTEMVLTSRGENEMQKDEFKYFSEKFVDTNLPLQNSWICGVKSKT